MYYSKKTDMKLYEELMTEIKKINGDWINLRTSKQYKIGLVFFETLQCIKKINIKKLIKLWKRWITGFKSSKTKSSVPNSEIIVGDSNYFTDERIAIYTAVFGNYDKVPEPYICPDNCDFYILTDQEVDENSIWKKIEVPKEIEKYSNVEKNRYLKMHPEIIFKQYKYSIYIDGNIQVMTDLTEYVNMLNHYGIGIHMHNSRTCVFDELNVVLKIKKDTKQNVEKHRKYLQDTGMPRNYGLLECGVIVREHNNPLCIEIMNEWWEEFNNYSKRDQISLPHVLFSKGIPVSKIGILGNNIHKNPSFRVLKHL